jgi:hypothetical protein
MDLAAATALFEKIFREKTGVNHADATGGAAPIKGK